MEEETSKLTPEQTIELFVHDNFNLEIYNKISEDLNYPPIPDMAATIEYILGIAEMIFIKIDEPLKLIDWTRKQISKHPEKAQIWILELVFRITDERIENKTIHYHLIKKQLIETDFSENIPEKTSFNGFTNYITVEKQLESKFRLKGFLMKKKDAVKKYLEENSKIIDEIKKEGHSQPTKDKGQKETSEKIKKHFGFFQRNCPRGHKQILNDEDFKKLIEWTTDFYEKEFKVPEISEPIKAVNTNQGFVRLAFRYLFKELHKSSPYPKSLFDFYKSAFEKYSQDKRKNFEAEKNNDEVKKLMQIHY